MSSAIPRDRATTSRSSKRSTGGLQPAVPLPGGSSYGGRLSAEHCYHHSHNKMTTQEENHQGKKHQQQQQPRRTLESHSLYVSQQQKHFVEADDDGDVDDDTWSSNEKENNHRNNSITPDNSEEQQLQQQQKPRCSISSSSVVMSSGDDSYDCGGTSSSYATASQTIALFGASGITGGHFLQMALDAGYGVRCLPEDDPRGDAMGGVGGAVGKKKNKGPNAASTTSAADWKSIKAGLQDTKELKRVIKSVDFVVVMLNDLLPDTKKKGYPQGFLPDFLCRLYPLMRREASIQVFLYQATSLATDARGQTPMLSKVLKVVAQRRNHFLRDQDAVVRKIASEHMLLRRRTSKNGNTPAKSKPTTPPHFSFVVTRPTVLLQDGPSSKKLSASKSQPGPFPVAHVDLAEFSLNALSTERLYNTSPYIVADSF